MQMDWKPYFHISFDGGIFLFPFLRVNSLYAFIVSSSMTVLVCWIERFLTFLINKKWQPWPPHKSSRLGTALWRAGLYWLVTFARLIYMLVAMSFHLGLLLVTVTALAVAQFMIEWNDLDHGENNGYQAVPDISYSAPPPDSPISHSLSMDDMSQQKPLAGRRRHPRPESLTIHPSGSNIARAEAAAQGMGLLGETENVAQPEFEEGRGGLWGAGEGGKRAKEMLGP